jgi:DNA-binding LacI/PurR family transcriptional regulator
VATLKDVAERAGVSLGTASNAFNRPDAVMPWTREQVMDAARELGYGGPDPAARRLRTGRAGAFGLIFTSRLPWAFSDQAATTFLRGVAEGLEEAGAAMLIVPTYPSREEAAKLVRDSAVDGFIVYSVPEGDPRVTAAHERGLPVIVVDQPDNGEFPFVGIDDRAAARAAAQHLVDLGHERIAVLAFPERVGDDLPFPVTIDRLAGYRDVLGDPPVYVSRGDSQSESYEQTGRALDAEPRPTALLAMSDALATGALRAAADRGLEVPRDLSVVGFDDSPTASLTSPPLTTVRQPTLEKGRLAAACALAGVESKPPIERKMLLPTELVIRGSTGPPP